MFREAVGVSFWCVCSPKLVLENLLEMLLRLELFLKGDYEIVNRALKSQHWPTMAAL